jgi:hypothetical protein
MKRLEGKELFFLKPEASLLKSYVKVLVAIVGGLRVLEKLKVCWPLL